MSLKENKLSIVMLATVFGSKYQHIVKMGDHYMFIAGLPRHRRVANAILMQIQAIKKSLLKLPRISLDCLLYRFHHDYLSLT